MNKFILNADDFGLDEHSNSAVLNCYKKGIIKSASLIVNTESFFKAADILSLCPDLSTGIHLNIFEGKPLSDCPKLTKNGEFKKSFLFFFFNQYNKEVLNQIEKEFRCQIEKMLKYAPVEHIDSHVHIHAIPSIFKITAKLTKEYDIKFVRTQFEVPYLVFFECFSLKFLINLIKIILLNFYTIINRKTLTKLKLKTNDYIIGVGYSGMMNSKTVNKGFRVFKDKKNIFHIARDSEQKVIEGIIHPYKTKEVEFDIIEKTTNHRGVLL